MTYDRLRNEPVRYLSLAELDEAHAQGFVSPALLRAEKWRRHVEQRTNAAIAARRDFDPSANRGASPSADAEAAGPPTRSGEPRPSSWSRP